MIHFHFDNTKKEQHFRIALFAPLNINLSNQLVESFKKIYELKGFIDIDSNTASLINKKETSTSVYV